MLAGADGFQLIQVHQQIVAQRHLLVELVREVQVIQVVLAQVLRQQSTQERRLATTLGTNQRGHALVAVVCVQLQPVGHRRAHPDGQEVQLLRADAWQS